AIQLARWAGLIIFTTASQRHEDHLQKLGASVVTDYRSPTVVEDLLSATARAGTKISRVIDAISTPETLPMALRVLHASSTVERKLAYTLPWPKDVDAPCEIETTRIVASEIGGRREDLATWIYSDMLSKLLE